MIERLYQVVRAVRYQVLLTQFGFVSHCPHSPTCGTKFIQVVRERGLIRALPTALHALRCVG